MSEIGTGVRGETALDLVRRTVAGDLTPRELTARLRRWVYAPRRRVYATTPQEFFTPNSLDAVDAAYFTHGLLTDDAYSEITESATIRPSTVPSHATETDEEVTL